MTFKNTYTFSQRSDEPTCICPLFFHATLVKSVFSFIYSSIVLSELTIATTYTTFIITTCTCFTERECMYNVRRNYICMYICTYIESPTYTPLNTGTQTIRQLKGINPANKLNKHPLFLISCIQLLLLLCNKYDGSSLRIVLNQTSVSSIST